MSARKLLLPSEEEALRSPRTTMGGSMPSGDLNGSRDRFGSLSPEEQKEIEDFAKSINLRDKNLSTKYALGAQENLSKFTDKALQGVTGRDIGDVSELLANMSIAIRGFNDDFEDELGKGKPLRFLSRAKKNLATSKERLKVRYDDVTKTLDDLIAQMERRCDELNKDVEKLDLLYNSNSDYFKELTMYIMAGRIALKDATEIELVELGKIAEETGLAEDAQAYSDFQALCSGFEKRLYDIELTREICLQTAPQFRLLQNSDRETIQQLTSAINNSIPLWKHGITTGLALERNERANNAVQVVRDLTSEMLVRNAERLHTNSVKSAKLSEEGYIDPKAIAKCNEWLIKTILDTSKIHAEGLTKRNEARTELGKLEENLKEALLQPYADAKTSKGWVA